MTKEQIYFSNAFEELLFVLKENLYPSGCGPFEKRLIIVPHLGLKFSIMQTLGKDPDLQVAAGLDIVNLTQGLAKVSGKKFLSQLELSLLLEHELIGLIDQEPELSRYFERSLKERRIGPFCDTLAKYFLRYAIFGKKSLPKWQEILWKKWENSFPSLAKTNWKIHLFGFSFLPELYLHFFGKLEAKMYFFSPCEIFWGDFYSKKERKRIEKQIPARQRDLFEESFAEQNPLLANWGKVGRQFFLMAEESSISTQEYYIPPKENGSLHNLQKDFLSGSFSKQKRDDTLRFVSATSLFHEIEVLKEQITEMCKTKKMEPKDIQVFAPDISQYAPYIHAIFSDWAYAISDLSLEETDPISRGFKKMLELPEKRFEKEEVFQVLTHLGMDVSLVKRWIEKAGVYWGFSKKQRELFYLEDFLPRHIHANTEEGTWEYGIQKLLHGLGAAEGLQAISSSEMVEFDRFYTLLISLMDDLAPLHDQTKWTISTWLRYLACLLESYFAIDPSHGLYKQLIQLAAWADPLDKEKVSYEGVKRVFLHLLGKKNKSHQPPHLQALRFASLAEGALQPGAAIFLIGLNEGNFPRIEEKSSLYGGVNQFCPNQTEIDRYLFLQALCSARKFFSTSYIEEEGPSFLIQELLVALEGGEVDHHKKQVSLEKEPKPPLISSFFTSTPLALSELVEMDLDVQKLCKFARHPLRYYLHEALGIFPAFQGEDQREFLLDPITKAKMVRKALLDGVQEEELSAPLLKSFAKKQIQKEVEEWEEALQAFGLDKEQLHTKKISISIGPVHLKGKLEFCTEKGLLVRGKNQLEDQIRFWPQGLLMKELGLPILFTKDQSTFTPNGDFKEYLAYFQVALQHPSPLVPTLAKSLLQGGDFPKALKQVEDEVFAYLFFRDGMPSGAIIQKNWKAILPQLFGRAFAEV